MDGTTSLPRADYLSRKVVAVAAGEAHTLALTGMLHRHPEKEVVIFVFHLLSSRLSLCFSRKPDINWKREMNRKK